MVEQTATATALGQAAGTATRHSSQNVQYKMKYNASTGKWEQEQIMTPLVHTIYPGIRTKEGKTKDISTGLVSQPEIQPIATTPEPEVTPLPQITHGIGGIGGGGRGVDAFQRQKDEYVVTGRKEIGGVKYESNQLKDITPAKTSDKQMAYNVMPGGFNRRSSAQMLGYSEDVGVLSQLINPQPADETKKKIELPSAMKIGTKIIGSVFTPRSERHQINRLLDAKIIQVRDSKGQILSIEDAKKRLTQDENGRLNILKGDSLLKSGYKVEQIDRMSNEYRNSPAFMNTEKDRANNFVLKQSDGSGIVLTTLNPVAGSAGINFKNILNIPGHHTNGEQVLVVDASNGGAYRSDGKLVGKNGQVYAFGTAAQAAESANKGLIPEDVLKRMQNPDGSLKDLYTSAGGVNAKWIDGVNIYAITDNVEKRSDGKWYYVGNTVNPETKNIITDGGEGDVIGNTQKDKEPDYVTKEPERQPTEGQQDARERMRERESERRESSRDRATRQEYQKDVEQTGKSRV